MNENLSFPEIIKRSKSITLHPTLEIDTKTIKQIGNYTIGAEVGSGAFGKVVLGKHILTGESVAIKILDKLILSQTPEDYELVRQEISILKIVKHKYIVRLYEILQTPQHIYIVMEYCEGKDLMDFILSKKHLSEVESLKYFQQLINALFYLHSQNIAHRDVKIDNMLLDKNKNLKLVDFGLSTKYSDDTLLDQPCGTVVYAAPEVLDGNEYHGMLADVWSSGIVLYGMAAGYLPFSDQNDEVNKKDVLEGRIEIPDFFSPMLKDLLHHMLDVNPITRYTLEDIRQHPWFNFVKQINLIPGIIIGYNKIPVDENILNLCVTYNADKNKVEQSVKNNKYDSGSALYYLLVKKITKKGFQSVSDLSSEAFINFILDENNLIKKKSNYNTKSHNNYNPIIIKEYDDDNTTNEHIFASSSRNMENLGAAPGLLPPEENINNSVKKDKKRINNNNIMNKPYKKNKVNSMDKNNKYISKNSGDIYLKKPFVTKKNEMKNKNYNLGKNIIDANRRINNSAQLRNKHIKKVNKDEEMPKQKNIKINKNIFQKKNIINNIKIKLSNKESENNVLSTLKDESSIVKSNRTRNNGLNLNEVCSLEFKSETEKVGLEILKNNKLQKDKSGKKTPIKNNKKYITKESKQSTLKLYQKNSSKFKSKNKKNSDYLKNIKKNKKEKNFTNAILQKETKERYSVNSCINIKTANYLKTPNNHKNKINNYRLNNNIINSHKNINNERNGKNILDEIKTKKGNYLNTSTSDKFSNLKYYNIRQPLKHIDNISKSIRTSYNTKYNESKKKEKNIKLLTSNKKKDYSLYHKKNNITNILGLNYKELNSLENSRINDLSDSKLILKNNKKNNLINSLNLSLNKSSSNSKLFKNSGYPLNKTKNINEYQIENTIYEFKNKNIKKKNRIRLDYNPNKNLELVSSGNNDKKKKNGLNKSVTIGKTDDKKITGLSIYMNNYNKPKARQVNLESSVLTQRKIYGYSIRDLSYSPNQKFLNEKTRKERIPWKYHKKGIDNKLTTETIYNKYLKRINKNPLNPTGNKMIKINKKKKNKNSENNLINNSLLKSVNMESKILNQTNIENQKYKNNLENINNNLMRKIMENQKEAKERRKLSIDKRTNIHKDKINSNKNIKEKNKLSTNDMFKQKKKLNSSISTKIKNLVNADIILKKENETYNIFDLSCLVIKEKNLKKCKDNLINKIKKNGFNVTSNKINDIKFTKNKINCQIEISKINSCLDNENCRDVFCLKINNKRSEVPINKIISKIISI